MTHMHNTGTGQGAQADSTATDKVMPTHLQPYRTANPYKTKDGSIIRELMHPAVQGNHAQSLAHATVPTGRRTLLHRHHKTEELYHVVGGRGRMTLGEDTFPVKTGDTVCIPPGTPHRIETIGPAPLRILCCCSPAYAHEDTELMEDEPEAVAVLPQPQKPFRIREPHPMNLEKIRAMRKRLGLSQGRFWGAIQVEQSTASRYESGREVPRPVLTLLLLAFGTQCEALALLKDLRHGLSGKPKPTLRALKAAETGEGAKALRKSLGLNQTEFWGRVMASQSGGARYEMGRDMPEQVAMLLQFVFGPERYVTSLLSALRKENPLHDVLAADVSEPASS